MLCATCHGVDGGGGSATFVVKSDDPRCDPNAAATEQTPVYCLPQQVSWAAPNLQFYSHILRLTQTLAAYVPITRGISFAAELRETCERFGVAASSL